jgi:hypothetical protein
MDSLPSGVETGQGVASAQQGQEKAQRSTTNLLNLGWLAWGVKNNLGG